MSYTQPSVVNFKDYFARDFPFGATTSYVMDADITKALTQMEISINPDLFNNQGSYTIGALLLSAHFLVLNLRASSQGISGSWGWMTSSKGVGSVNASYQIPDRILANPEFSILSQTTYGMQYLAMILPALTAQIFTVRGTTRA